MHQCRNPSLGLATKVRACKGVGQEGSPRITSHAPRNVGKCEGMNLHTPKWTPTLGVGVSMDSWIFKKRLGAKTHWIEEFLILSKYSNYKGQNPLDSKKNYIIKKLLEFRCLKWARMTHLDTSNTSYGQKKGRESNWQFDSQPLKVKNHPNFLACRWRATYHWKALNKGYNFSLNLISIGGLHTKLWAPKVAGFPTLGTLGILGLPLGVSGQNDIWVLVLWPGTK
jgi:hypothetical protein